MATILAACANGAGSSLLMKMAVEKVVKELNMNVTKVTHSPISEAKSIATQFEMVFVPNTFLNMFEGAIKKGVHVIGLRNVMSAAEIKEKIIAEGLDKKFAK